MPEKHPSAREVIRQLPPEYPQDLLPVIRDAFLRCRKTLVVLDDDPTGTQTCRDVQVLTVWNVDVIAEALRLRPSILFILTNSRSMTEQDAVAVAAEVGANLREASRQSERDVLVVSRSDSTLRGHFPAEVDALGAALGMPLAVRVLVPAFIEGARYTIGDVHYIVENDELIPTSETPFARDTVFGYKHAQLKEWVEEKTRGVVRAGDVVSVSLGDLRTGGPDVVGRKLINCNAGSVVVANAVSYRDIEVLVLALQRAEDDGRQFLYRTSATFVPLRAGLPSGEAYQPTPAGRTVGSLTIVGSHVPKSTRQLERLIGSGQCDAIEIDVASLIDRSLTITPASVAQQIDALLMDGVDVLVFTSRKLETGSDARESLQINARVSDFLVRVVQLMRVQPAFMIAKGGITSHDVASKGLSAVTATILGAVIPGVPVWGMDAGSKFPGMAYVVFPGNVGDDDALLKVYRIFKG